MIITCKACQKRYLLEKEDIGPEGRQVRCIACGHSWQQYHIEETLNTIFPKSTTFDPGYIMEVKASKRSPWTVLIGGILTISFAFYLARTPIVSRWPEAEKIFTAFKIPVSHPYEGVALENIVPMQLDHLGSIGYALKGEVVNQANEVRPIPTFEIIAQGDCKYASPAAQFHHFMRGMKAKLFHYSSKNNDLCVLESWTYRLAESRIFPGEKIMFETPPRSTVIGATNISIEF